MPSRKTNSKHITGIDYLKVLSIVMVIMFHYEWNSGFDWSKFSFSQRVIADCVYMLGEIGVNCFMLCTGFLMINKVSDKGHFKRITKIWNGIFFYSLVSFVLVHFLVSPYNISFKTFAAVLMPVSFKTWWYTTCYFVIICISPYLNSMLNSLPRESYKKLLIIPVVLFSLVPTFLGFLKKDTESFTGYSRLIWMMIVYCLGGYIKLYYPKEELCSKRKKCIVVNVSVWIFLTAFIMLAEKGIISGRNISARYFWSPNSIPVLLLSVSLFVLFLSKDFPSLKLINIISGSTLGIYQMHGGRSGKLWWNNIFHKPQYIGTYGVFAEMISAVLLILFVGVVIDLIRKAIVKLQILIKNKMGLD